MSFDFDNNTPIYLQLVEQIKINIVSGVLGCGERLPSVRDLAQDNKVNPNTMQKALVELEAKGLIFTERTNGKFVTTDQKLIDNFKKEYADSLADKFFSAMADIGLNKRKALEYLKEFGGKE